MRVLTVFGTRPEAIKMAPLALRLAVDPRFEAKVCVTAQYREMLGQVLALFRLTPDYDLNLMKPGQSLTELISRILTGLEEVLRSFQPHVVLVHGVTPTTMAASLAAYYQQISVAHVEAGLRTGNMFSPWLEERNHKPTGVLASLHFAPTQTAYNSLSRVGVPGNEIFITRNTVIDALLTVKKSLRNRRFSLQSFLKSSASSIQLANSSSSQTTAGKALATVTPANELPRPGSTQQKSEPFSMKGYQS